MTLVSCIGLAVHDVIFTVDALPTGSGKTHAARLQDAGGGPAANAATAVAALGGRAHFVGVLGDDDLGDTMVQDLNSRGVDTSRVRRLAGFRSPLSAVTVDAEGERAIVNHADPDMFTEAAPPTHDDLEGSSAVLVDVRWADGAAAGLTWARDNGVPGVLDYDIGDENGPRLLTLASHVVFSAAALARLTAIPDPAAGLVGARGMSSAWLAVTIGREGTIWLDGNDPRHEPAFPVEVVDTSGAGDVYHGAFTLVLASGRDERVAMQTAAGAAALSCTRLGGRDGVPTRDELDRFLEQRQ